MHRFPATAADPATHGGRSRRPLRTVAVGLLASATVIGIAGLPTVASAAVQAHPTQVSSTTQGGTSTVRLADWSQAGWGQDGWGQDGWGQDGWGQGDWSQDQWGQDGSGGSWGDPGTGGSGGSSEGGIAVDSQPATAAEAKGVVLINTKLSYAGAEGAGTGMILTSSGQVLTNYHVVEGATEIVVTVASTGKTYRARVIGHDQTHDIALLQLKNASGLDTVKTDDDSVAVGDAVTAVGNAGGTGSLTAAEGSVTSLSATVTTAAEGTVASETLRSMIETDADVVAGDSGGPLYDDEGEVVGIDTAASTGSEIDGYAIPIKEALAVVAQIRSGDDTSTVQIGAAAFLGVTLIDNSGADSSGADSTQAGGFGGWQGDDSTAEGATIGGVIEGGPAAKAGLAEGDTITAVGSHAVTTADQLKSLLATYAAGDKVKITWTDAAGTTHGKSVTLAASPVA
ncbi:S1C family serine protease [Microlunatus ginsengisoli]|uniref:PDZ domain-containing protein n=1 Tax=Microlunatus ginsengisoli TaxID=363863 RepID=A0ABP6ZP17_9ACTN